MSPCRKCGAQDRNKHGQCKPCKKMVGRKWAEDNREKFAEYHRKYREANREKRTANTRKYYEANPEKVGAYYRKYYEANKEKIADQKRKHYEANREKSAERLRKWKKANFDKVRVIEQNRRSRIEGNGGRLSKDIVQTLIVLQKGKCACCGENLSKGYHIDHIMPIALGGKNTDENVQLLTPKCNLSKGAKHPVDYMRSKGRLI